MPPGHLNPAEPSTLSIAVPLANATAISPAALPCPVSAATTQSAVPSFEATTASTPWSVSVRIGSMFFCAFAGCPSSVQAWPTMVTSPPSSAACSERPLHRGFVGLPALFVDVRAARADFQVVCRGQARNRNRCAQKGTLRSSSPPGITSLPCRFADYRLQGGEAVSHKLSVFILAAFLASKVELPLWGRSRASGLSGLVAVPNGPTYPVRPCAIRIGRSCSSRSRRFFSASASAQP